MKQIIYYALVLLFWSLAVVLWAIWHFPFVVLGLVVLHAFETLAIGITTGIRYGVSIRESVGMCMVFGIAWWLPLRRKMKAETFTDADFMMKE